MTIPNEFFTIQSLLTLTGATGVTVVVCNGMQSAFNFNPRWLGLAVAEVIALWGVWQTHGQGSDYFIGVINGFLIYCTAIGATQMGATTTGAKGDSGSGAVARSAEDAALPQPPQNRRRFFTPWF